MFCCGYGLSLLFGIGSILSTLVLLELVTCASSMNLVDFKKLKEKQRKRSANHAGTIAGSLQPLSCQTSSACGRGQKAERLLSEVRELIRSLRCFVWLASTAHDCPPIICLASQTTWKSPLQVNDAEGWDPGFGRRTTRSRASETQWRFDFQPRLELTPLCHFLHVFRKGPLQRKVLILPEFCMTLQILASGAFCSCSRTTTVLSLWFFLKWARKSRAGRLHGSHNCPSGRFLVEVWLWVPSPEYLFRRTLRFWVAAI